MIDYILAQVAKNESFKQQAFKVAKGNDLYKDIISELIISLSEMHPQKLITLYNNKELDSYCYKVIWLSWNSKTSPFYRKFLKLNEFIEVDTEVGFDISKTLIEDMLNDLEKNRVQYPSDINIYRLYLKFGSLRKVSKEIDVPHTTIAHIVNRITRELQDNL